MVHAIVVNAAIVGERPTGLGVYTLGVIRGIAERGQPLTVVTSRPEAVAGPGIDVQAAPPVTRPERRALGHLARLLWVQTGFRSVVRRIRPSVVFNPLPEGLLRPPVPQVTTVLDLLPLRYPGEYPRQQYYFRHYVPAVLRWSRAIVVISESTRRDVLRFYPQVSPESIHLAPPGYDSVRFSPDGPVATSDDIPYVLYIGNVMPHKNLVRLIEAFALARAQVDVRLVIRGTGHARYVRAVQAAIAAHRVGPYLDWQPYADADALPALYRGARALLLPSLYEGFGLTALEAMACGTPVVATSSSSLPEVTGGAAVLIDPHDTKAWADAIVRLVTDDASVRDLRPRALARAAEFSWDRTARAVLQAIEAALA
ncbi:MAG TPA: glycosyltransferase family 1 protein [Gemmatimonadaceae bacterium]|nr:glycosyltransferase family 1 protein [Gemmatimonadaceae bacterium]